MVSAQILNCMVCEEPVRPRQQAIQCDGCFRWNHRICNTGKFSRIIFTYFHFLSATDLNNASPLHTFKFLSVINIL